ncbi:MAG: porin [Candidatus Electrothrix sp. GW3-4]|uniref:porin n=1 Tax=Candidatus Electrothrix sp. GW3-4 TaxID=3126740 RepID=UPI0030D08D32
MKKCYSTGALTMTVGAMLLGGAVSASALEVKSGNDNVQLNLYGHINRAVMSVDDGNETKIFHVDNTNSESRIGINGEVAAYDSLTIGGNVEVEWQSNPSHKVSMQEESISSELKERKMEVYFDSEKIGKLSIGRGDMVSNGSSEVDLSGTGVAGNSGAADAGGGFAFVNTTPVVVAEGEEAESITVGDVFDQMDGLSRRNRVRYDTPTFGGFSFGVSAGEEERADVALTYSGKFAGGTKLKAAVAYSDPGEGGDYTLISGSASLLLGFGLNFTVAGGTRDLDDMPAGGDDPTFMYGKIGYKTKIFSAGSTACSFDYGVYSNIENQDTEEEGTAFGVQVVQKFSDYNTELFAAYRNFELEDNTGADYEPITLALAGVRLKF